MDGTLWSDGNVEASAKENLKGDLVRYALAHPLSFGFVPPTEDRKLELRIDKRRILTVFNILTERFPIIISQMFGSNYSLDDFDVLLARDIGERAELEENEKGNENCKGLLRLCKVIDFLLVYFMRLKSNCFHEFLSWEIEEAKDEKEKEKKKANASFLPSYIFKVIANDAEFLKVVQRRGKNWTVLGEGQGFAALRGMHRFVVEPPSLWMDGRTTLKKARCFLHPFFISLPS